MHCHFLYDCLLALEICNANDYVVIEVKCFHQEPALLELSRQMDVLVVLRHVVVRPCSEHTLKDGEMSIKSVALDN